MDNSFPCFVNKWHSLRSFTQLCLLTKDLSPTVNMKINIILKRVIFITNNVILILFLRLLFFFWGGGLGLWVPLKTKIKKKKYFVCLGIEFRILVFKRSYFSSLSPSKFYVSISQNYINIVSV